MEGKVFRVGSFDGGGCRGIIQLKILETFAGRDFKPVQYYDMLVGTSVGALNAGLFAAGKSVGQVLDVWQEWMPKIFKRNWTWPVFARTKYWGEGIEKCLQKELPNLKLSSMKVPFIACSFSTMRKKAVYLKSTKYPNLVAWKALRASMAAPVYFPPTKLTLPPYDTEDVLVDGGVANNDPAAVAFAELCNPKFVRNNCIDLPEKLQFDSFGCGLYQDITKPGLPFLLISKLLEILSWTMNSSTDNVEQFMTASSAVNSDVIYRRFQPTLPYDVPLDDLAAVGMMKCAAVDYANYLKAKGTKLII